MINITRLALTFLGTILTLMNVVKSKPNKAGTTHAELARISPEQHKNKLFSIYGLSLMATGFILQFYAAICDL